MSFDAAPLLFYLLKDILISPDSKGNIHDEASLQQLIVLANIESLNVEFIRQGLPQK